LIDTIEKEYNTKNIDIPRLLREPMILGKTVKINEGFIKFGLKPSKEVNRGLNLITTRDSLERIEEMEGRNNLYIGRVTQSHYAIDVDGELSRDYKHFKLLLECLLLSRKWTRQGKSVFRTFKNDNEIGNIKIRNSYRSTTVYDCSDKRVIGIRFEDREMLRSIKTGDKKAIIDHMQRLISEVDKIELYIPNVEKEKINSIIREYKLNQDSYSSFSEFISNQEEKGSILTKNILVGIYKGVGMKGNVNGFVRDFRRLRPSKLNFVSKKNIRDLGEHIKKNIKADLKELRG